MAFGLLGSFLSGRHSSAKTDRGNFLGGIQNLENVFNYAMPTATGELKSGTEKLDTAGNYYQKLLSGNRQAVLGAVAPETASVTARADAERRQLNASGTARGGGTAALNQTAKDRTMAQVDQLLFGVRPEAAKGVADVGRTEASIGTNLLGQAIGAESTVADESRASRGDSAKIHQDAVNQVSTALENVMAAMAFA